MSIGPRGGAARTIVILRRAARFEPDVLPKQQPWQPKQLNEDQMRNNPQVIPAHYRPEVILRFDDQKTLLLSGLLDKSGYRRTRHCGQRSSRSGQCSAVRKQPRLSRRDHWKLRPGLQRILNHDRLKSLPAGPDTRILQGGRS